MKKKIKNIIIIILIIIIGIGITKIIDKTYKYYKSNKSYEVIRSEINNEKFIDESLKKINSDYEFWINIPNTKIDYPVVKGTDNEFYLSHNFYKEKDIAGTIFIDYNNDVSLDKNLILYGHNMKNGSMFAEINKFKEQKYFNDGIINIKKNGKIYTYEIFSVFVEKGDELNLKIKFNSDEEFNEYIKDLKEKSLFYKEKFNNEISNIITLYTCSYEFDDARTIVFAYRIE